jgi:uncharacterized protein (TIGR02996 family)
VSEDEARLHRHLDEQPDDGQIRLILADLLEEQGQADAAYCQRWLAKQHKWPDNKLGSFNKTGWHWWACPDRPERRREHATLPVEVQKHMPQMVEWLYKDRAEAEAVLARALALAREESAK